MEETPKIETKRGEKEKMTEFLESKARELSEATERPFQEVLNELEDLVRQGYSEAGAIVKWKSNNKFQLGERQEFLGRLIAIEKSRKVNLPNTGETSVTNYHFAIYYPDINSVIFRMATIWGDDRADKMRQQMQVNKVYKFKASLKPDGTLNRIMKIEPADDTAVDSVQNIEPVSLDKIHDASSRHELVRGMIGRLISMDGQLVGFEISDLTPAPPVTVWFGGLYSRMSPEDVERVRNMNLSEGMEVVVYGFINVGSDGSARVNAINIWSA